MHNILGKMKIKTGDVFLLGRMKDLAEQDKIEITATLQKDGKNLK